MNDRDGRPDPLRAALANHGPIPAAVGALASALVAAGILSTTGVTVAGVVLASVSALVTAGTSVATAWKVITAARAGVTPTADPRTNAGDELVPRTGQLLAEVLQQILDAGQAATAAASTPATPSTPRTTPLMFVPVPDEPGRRAATRAVPPADERGETRPTDPATTRLGMAQGRHQRVEVNSGRRRSS